MKDDFSLIGNLVVLKGILYHFNVLNDEGHLGYFYDDLRKEWRDLQLPGIKYKAGTPYHQPTYPVVIVPYFG